MITRRERDILERRARGETQAAIAHALGISQSVVCRSERRVYEKLRQAHELINAIAELGVDVTPHTKRGFSPPRKPNHK